MSPGPQSVDAMAEAIERFVIGRDRVTFAELSREIPGFAAERGEASVMLEIGKQLLWAGHTAFGQSALMSLFDRKRLCIADATEWTYMFDGAVLDAKSWRPVTLRPGAMANFDAGGLLFHLSPDDLAKAQEKKHPAKRRRRPRPGSDKAD